MQLKSAEMIAESPKTVSSDVTQPSSEDKDDNDQHFEKYNNKQYANRSKLSKCVSYCSKMLHFQSLRDLQYAFQMTCCFVFGALIAYKSPYKDQVAIPYFLVLLAPLLITDTFAGTLLSCKSCLINFVPGCCFVYVLQVIGMGYHNYTSTTILFLCMCFWLGYVNPSAGPRKIALLLPTVLFVTLVTTPRSSVTDTFAWDVCGMACMSLVIDIAVSCLVFPRFACIEAQDRFSYSLARSGEVLELVTRAFMATHKASAEVFLCEAESIVQNMSANQSALELRASTAWVEPVALLRWMLRGNQKAFNRFDPPELARLSTSITWHLTAVIHATRNTNFNEYHAIASDLARESFLQTAYAYQALVHQLHCSTHDTEKLDTAVSELKRTGDHMFARLSQSLRVANQTAQGAETGEEWAGRPHTESEVYCLEDIELDNTTTNNIKPLRMPYSSAQYDGDAKKGANRMSVSFFLFHVSELIQTVDSNFTAHHTAVEAKSPTGATTVKSAAPFTLCVWLFNSVHQFCAEVLHSYTADWRTKTKMGLRTAFLMGVGLIFVEVPRLALKFENGQWILFGMLMAQGDNLGGTLYQSRNRLLGTLLGAIFGYFVFLSVGTNHYHLIGMFVPYIMMCGVIKQSKQWSYFGSIAATTAIIVTLGRVAYHDPLVGDYSLLRIQQNALGILLSLACSVITIPVFAVDLLKLNIVQVFDKLATSTSKVLQVYETTVVSSVAPDSSTVDSQQSDQRLGNATYDAIAVNFGGVDVDEEELTVLQDNKKVQLVRYIAAEGALVRAKLSQQPLLIEQSAMELVYWAKPFPEEAYHRLIACQRRVQHMMVTIDRALLRISTITQLKAVEASLLFGHKVRDQVSELLTEVVSNLQRWKRLMHSTVRSYNATSSDAEESERLAATKFTLESRAEHSRGMEKMHQAAIQLAQNSLKFNNEMMRGWLDSVLRNRGQSLCTSDDRLTAELVGAISASETTTGNISKKNTDADIHCMFDILTTFNSLFYASSHLATAAMDLGNTLYSILLLEKTVNHKPF